MEWCNNSIVTWDEFKGKLKRQFYLENVEHKAKAKLRQLQFRGNVKDYVKEFSKLLLEINNFFDNKTLSYFIDGLQLWAKVEIQQRETQDLNTAIAIAESLAEYMKLEKSKDPKHGKGKNEDRHHSKDGA